MASNLSMSDYYYYYYYYFGQFYDEMLVRMTLLECCDGLDGVSRHHYHSTMSLDPFLQPIFHRMEPTKSYEHLICSWRLYHRIIHRKWTMKLLEEIDLARMAKEMFWDKENFRGKI